MSTQELEIEINKLDIWPVQIHNLPLGFNEERVNDLANYARRVIGVSKQEGELEKTKYATVMVVVDVIKPLTQGYYLERRTLKSIWIDFRYDRIPTFCKKVSFHWVRGNQMQQIGENSFTTERGTCSVGIVKEGNGKSKRAKHI